MAKRKRGPNGVRPRNDPTRGPESDRVSGPSRLVPLAAVWIVVAIADVAFSALIPNTSLQNAQLPAGARISLVAYALTLLMVAVGVVTGSVMLLGRARGPAASRAVRWSIWGLQAFLVWVAVLLYLASWATFWNAGVFLDREAFLFWLPHPIQVFHWV